MGARVQRNGSTLSEFGSSGPTSTEQLEKLAVDNGRYTNIGFVNSSTSAASWIACKGAFIQDFPNGKISKAASAMGS
ncbi:hypothetical protein TNCV_93731 [Trichonephila clavipes]|nr:hypothetical protein TNCV_93731 [Trichonephila clavipes]